MGQVACLAVRLGGEFSGFVAGQGTLQIPLLKSIDRACNPEKWCGYPNTQADGRGCYHHAPAMLASDGRRTTLPIHGCFDDRGQNNHAPQRSNYFVPDAQPNPQFAAHSMLYHSGIHGH